MAQQVLYVDPVQGQDDREGLSADQPLKTLSAALRRSQPDTVIRLKAGLYLASSGEQFPLTIPSGCQVIGETNRDRPTVILRGSGSAQHPSLGTQAVTCILLSDASLQDVSVANTTSQGIGLWFLEGQSQLKNSVVTQCPQTGVVILGTALPSLENSLFESCGTGVIFLSQSKGQMDRVICRDNDTGISLQDATAPLIRTCLLEQNKTGIAIADTANPVLRSSRIIRNQSYGLQLTGRATADLGQSQDPGNNVVRNNGQADIQNSSRQVLQSCQNDVIPQHIQGRVELIASAIPDASVIPPRLFDQPAEAPSLPDPVAPGTDEFAGVPKGSVRFNDMDDHWAGPFVDTLAQVGAVAGFDDGTFRPAKPVTRAQFAAFVLASFPDRPEKNAAIRFRDVASDFWAATAIAKAQRTGFLSGYPDGTVRPNESITRIQAIVAMINGLGFTGGRVDEIGIYRDRAQVPSYAVDALATATQRRLVVNYPDPLVLRPLEAMTRGEVSALIYQGRVAVGKSAAIESPYIVQPDTTQTLFSDLAGHWAANFVRGLAEANLVRGMSDGRFAPDAPMNRAQFAALIVNAFQPQPTRPATPFSDVPTDFWGHAAIQNAYQSEFMSGFPDGKFEPNHPLVRVQAWVSLVNGLNWEDLDMDLNPLGQFTDYTTIPRYALRSTAIAIAKGLIINHPDPTLLRPNQIATRAEICAAVYQSLVALERLPAIT
ncbi:MAG: S-layer homology domain-containing protein [Leptolyngbyaceae cyanobacterium]